MESYHCMNSRVMEFRMFLSSPGSVCVVDYSEEQIECHGEIAISTLNRKFALTSDVEPCLITRFNFAEEKQLSCD